eukprot:3553687-Rhodomonas_salina.1
MSALDVPLRAHTRYSGLASTGSRTYQAQLELMHHAVLVVLHPIGAGNSESRAEKSGSLARLGVPMLEPKSPTGCAQPRLFHRKLQRDFLSLLQLQGLQVPVQMYCGMQTECVYNKIRSVPH